MAFYKSKFTGEEIDQRLAQGTFDDAVKAGFTGTKEQFDQLLAKIQETTNIAEAAQPAESDELETVNKNIVDAINEIQIEVNTKQPIGDYATKIELAEETTARQTEDSAIRNAIVGKKTEQGGEIFNNYDVNIASNNYAHAEGNNTAATKSGSHAEGYATRSSGTNAHAEGANTIASGNASHSEGVYTRATHEFTHAEGNTTQATNSNAHAEGYATIAEGTCSHAEGSNTKAKGPNSHTEGQGTIA